MALARLFDRDDDFFANPFRALSQPLGLGPSLLTSNWQPIPATDARPIALDVVEKPDKYEIKADIPGVNEENIAIQVDGDVLNLSVEAEEDKEETKEEGGIKVHRLERSSTFVRRAIRLPESADTEKIHASLDNGVLLVEIPKKEQANRQRRVTVGKGKEGGAGGGQSEAKSTDAKTSDVKR